MTPKITPKKVLKALLPNIVVRDIQRYRHKLAQKQYNGLTTQQVFSKIYDEGAWGRSGDPSQKYYSGSGSHLESVAATYIQSVQTFLGSFEKKPNVVDLGCGDFSIGSRIRKSCSAYIACDIVPNLIAYNKEQYSDLGVDFRIVDLTENELPKGDVVFVRQVLQHLSNNHIEKALPKIAAGYRYLVLTEHLPKHLDFVPNLDKPAGPDVRLDVDSGLVLTKPPFNLNAIEENILCEVPVSDGIIRTIVYALSQES